MCRLVVGTADAAGCVMKGLVLTGLVGAGVLALAAGAGSPAKTCRPTGRVGKHWTWEELTVSPTAKRLGLDNSPPEWAMRNLEWMVRHALDPLRERYGRDAVRVNSAYRSPAVNRAVGGVANSLHQAGLAVDLSGRFVRMPGWARTLTSQGLRVIGYSEHLHVQLASRPVGLGS